MWLVDAFRQRPAGRATRVLTYFHELYANGRPWQRAFWYSKKQRRVAADIARLSDVLLTNRKQSARWLEEQTGRPSGSIFSLAIPSNVGEPVIVPDFESRLARVVSSGAANIKKTALFHEAQSTSDLLRRLEITELVDIGASTPIATGVFQQAGIGVEQLGYLPPKEVSQWLGQSRFGLLDYGADYAAKSGVFAAYAAHGVVPLLRPINGPPQDDLACPTHFFHMTDNQPPDAHTLRAASKNIVQWYRQHAVECHAEALLDALTEGPVCSTVMQVQR